MEHRTKHKLIPVLVAIAAAPWLIAATIEATSGEDGNTRIDIVGYGMAPQATQLLTMRAGVSAFATSASRAVADNAATMTAIRRQLERSGIDSRDIRTGNLSLQPSTHREGSGPSVDGFEVVHTLSINFRDVAKVGAVMDVLVAAGASQISGPNFSNQSTPEAEAPARLAAIRDAEQRAQFYAKTLGMKVRRVVTMRDGGSFASPQPAMALAEVPQQGTQVSPGLDVVRVSVIAQYELTR